MNCSGRLVIIEWSGCSTLEALCRLHTEGLVHGDIRSDTVFVGPAADPGESLELPPGSDVEVCYRANYAD